MSRSVLMSVYISVKNVSLLTTDVISMLLEKNEDTGSRKNDSGLISVAVIHDLSYLEMWWLPVYS